MEENSDIIINSKSKVKITGVEGITGFSENEAVFKTTLGCLAVTGFDKENGTVNITGDIQAVFYPKTNRAERGMFGKLFGKEN